MEGRASCSAACYYTHNCVTPRDSALHQFNRAASSAPGHVLRHGQWQRHAGSAHFVLPFSWACPNSSAQAFVCRRLPSRSGATSFACTPRFSLLQSDSCTSNANTRPFVEQPRRTLPQAVREAESWNVPRHMGHENSTWRRFRSYSSTQPKRRNGTELQASRPPLS